MDESNTTNNPISDGEEVIAAENEKSFDWTPETVLLALLLFVAAGFAEIGGGYLIWKAIRGGTDLTKKKVWLYIVLGSVILVVYGFIPTLQPTDTFGRIYAVYGGFFTVLSFLAGWYLDNDKPDLGDVVGGCVSLAGVLMILFWPRR
jgi:small multidrug resistance family-3 protein